MTGSFERAATAVVDGDVRALRRLLASDPGLVRARSGDAFDATLLHFVAANGVPDELQRSPANAPEVARVLLEAGADPDAIGGAYGGGENATPLCLLVSSLHPHLRGVQADLVHALVDGGARVDGRAGDGAPLTTALVFGYTAAAAALAGRGARTDNLFLAAGLGLDLDPYLGEGGRPAPGALAGYVPVVAKELDPADDRAVVQEAFHFAVTHGRVRTAERLLALGADVDGETTGHHGRLPLVQALVVGEERSALWLLERGADPDRRDGKRGESARAMVAREGPPSVAARLRRGH